jgi:hypothetical protein
VPHGGEPDVHRAGSSERDESQARLHCASVPNRGAIIDGEKRRKDVTMATKMATKAKVVTTAAKARPVVERVAKDEEFKKHVRGAYGSAKTIYDELFLAAPELSASKTRAMVAKLAADPQLQDEVRNAIAELRGATTRAKKASNPSHKGRNSLILAGIMIGILYNPKTGPDTRKWLKEKVFGPEETFEFEAA